MYLSFIGQFYTVALWDYWCSHRILTFIFTMKHPFFSAMVAMLRIKTVLLSSSITPSFLPRYISNNKSLQFFCLALAQKLWFSPGLPGVSSHTLLLSLLRPKYHLYRNYLSLCNKINLLHFPVICNKCWTSYSSQRKWYFPRNYAVCKNMSSSFLWSYARTWMLNQIRKYLASAISQKIFLLVAKWKSSFSRYLLLWVYL